MTNQSTCIVTFPVENAGVTPISNLIKILLKQSINSLYIITGNEGSRVGAIDARVQITNIPHQLKQNIVSRSISYAITQVKISFSILNTMKNIDTWLFFIGGEALTLPIIFAKLTHKPTILLFAGSQVEQTNPQKSWINPIIFWVSAFNCSLCDKLIIYSPVLIPQWNLEPYRHKILIAHEHFLDFNTFTITTPFTARPPLIGYIGRLSDEKGVQHFAQALPTILNNRQDLRALIGGDGPLRESIEASLQEGGVTSLVNFPGWISHDDLPEYLNQLQLLVLPSYTEGLPNIMLEAMACGTPVLATPVGAIPDIIVDGVTGFLMEGNSPNQIAENVIRALSSPDHEKIIRNGKQLVEENFTFECVTEKWKEVLEKV
ncbi:MAG: glycosyltransferase family 4 protein [Methanoculleus sp.]